MKAKGILIIGLICFLATGLVLLKQTARSDNPAPNPALMGITYVEGVATNGVRVDFTIQHGGYDWDISGHVVQDGEYMVGQSSEWGNWCVWATYEDSGSYYMTCVDGYREQTNPDPDVVNLYLVLSSPSAGCACWPQGGDD
jgi:hypothetical protein